VARQSGNVTKLEWVTCPRCSQTFQIAIPARTMDMRVWPSSYEPPFNRYCFRVSCINLSCHELIWIETDLPCET